MAKIFNPTLTLFLITTLSLGGCNSLSIQPQLTTGLVGQKGAEDKLTEPSEIAPELLTNEEIDVATVDPVLADIEAVTAKADAVEAAANSDDLWFRLRAGFQLEAPENKRVATHIRWYAANDSYLNRVQDRATPYLHYIVEEVERRGMPSEMALLPIVESAYKPFAYSPGRAAGLWQFIPSTGKYFGLQQNWWYDGRRDVVAATNAALDYLQKLSNQFDGDWELALASYNAGAGTIRRAIRKNKKQGKATDYWSLKLPKETMHYVPKFLALADVIKNANKHGIELAPIPNTPYFDSVDIGSQLDLALAADMAQISIEDLYRLNPGFNRWATAPKGPHRLIVPVEKAELFSQKLAQLSPDKRLQWKRYKIKSGDVLGTIARKHRTTVSLLRQVNKIRGNNIRAGKYLLIPVAAKSLDQYSFSAEQRQQKSLKIKRAGTKRIHRVRSGDTLWDIARSYKVNHKTLARWNNMSPYDTLKLGQKLVIWTKSGKSSSKRITQADLASPPIKSSSIRYRVRKGDSLARIAGKFNVSVADLKRWNQLPSKYLQPGQNIKLYVDVTAQTL